MNYILIVKDEPIITLGGENEELITKFYNKSLKSLNNNPTSAEFVEHVHRININPMKNQVVSNNDKRVGFKKTKKRN